MRSRPAPSIRCGPCGLVQRLERLGNAVLEELEIGEVETADELFSVEDSDGNDDALGGERSRGRK